MKLPSYVLECLNALEAAGYPAYVVGGCVRDACLGLQPHDYDICTGRPRRFSLGNDWCWREKSTAP